MVRSKLKQFKQLIQTLTKQKSVKVSSDGKVEIVCRFKPNVIKVSDTNKIHDLQDSILSKLESITNVKYKIISLQKQPAFCYNTYVRILRTSSANSSDKVKKYLPYFLRAEGEGFVKQSYSDITIILIPSNKDSFSEFLINE